MIKFHYSVRSTVTDHILEAKVVSLLTATYCMQVPVDVLPELYSCDFGSDVSWIEPRALRHYEFWRIQ